MSIHSQFKRIQLTACNELVWLGRAARALRWSYNQCAVGRAVHEWPASAWPGLQD